MDYKSVNELIEMVSTSKLSSFEMKFQGVEISMKKNNQNLKPIYVTETEEIEEINEFDINSMEIEDNIKIIKSPMIGTFYSAAGPGESTYVKKGACINKGDTICIIEAMKLMNEVESEVSGEVLEVCVKNEEKVEYNQALFKIKVK